MNNRRTNNQPMLLASGEDMKSFAIEATATVDIIQAAEGQPAKRPTLTIDAYNGGELRVANYFRPMIVDLAGLRASRVTVLRDHQPSQIIGQGKAKITQSPPNITVNGQVTGDHTNPNDPAHGVVNHSRNGFVWSASVGVSPERIEWVDAGAKVTVNGKEFTGPVGVVRAGRLGEVSLVGIGADETASATIAANAAHSNASEDQGENQMTFELWIKAQGHDLAKLSDDKKAKLQAAYDNLKAVGALPAVNATANQEPSSQTPSVNGAATTGDEIAKLRAERAAEYERIAKVEVAAKGHPTILANAIKDGWSVEKTELEVLRASRIPESSAPAIHVGKDGQLTGSAIEAALCITGGLKEPEKFFAPEVLEAAHTKVGRIGLQESIMLAASANGWHGRMTASQFRADHKNILAHAFGMSPIRAGFSTIDISGLLSNTANKFLLASFNAVEQVWRSISRINPMSDFKTVTRYRLTAGGEYAKVAPSGELKHGTLGNESYTNKVDTYGEMLTINRQDQYNDDLGSLTQVPNLLGGAAGRSLNSVFWTAFQDNASFFSADHKNLIGSTGRAWYLLAASTELPVMEVGFLDGRDTPVVETATADFNTLGINMRSYHDFGCSKAEYRAGIMSHTALSLAALEAGQKLFLDQTIDGTHPLALRPAILLVASGDIVTAMSLFKSTEVRDTTASTKAPTTNVFQGMFQPISSSYLSNS